MTQRETHLQRRIKKTLHREFPGSVFYKMHGNEFMESGIPDLIGSVSGQFVALEVKHPDTSHGVTAIQQAQLDRLHESGAIVGVVESPAEAVALVRNHISNRAVIEM